MTGMHILKRAKQHDGTIFGDVVPLAYVRALASLIPCFGKEAEKRSPRNQVWNIAWNFGYKYINKEFFYALNT